MENLISLLEAVYSTMDSISVSGIDNQDKFVGCANAIRTAIRQLRAERSETPAPAEPVTVKEE